MTQADLPGGQRPTPTPSQAWRWLAESVWKVEHAFERSKAEGRAADDTRLRIFFVLAIFALAFITLCLEAGRAALFSKAGGSGLSAPVAAEARTDLLDRQGRLLALDLAHFGLYLDPREVWDKDEVRRDLTTILPKLDKARLEKVLASGRREYLIGGLNPAERTRIHDLGLPGVAFEEEDRRVYPLGRSAAHLIGYADSSGHGLAGSERALDGMIRGGAGGGAPVQLSIDLRVQGALEDELKKAVAKYSALGGVGMVIDVKTGEILGYSSQPDFDPNEPGASPSSALVDAGAASVYEMGSVFKAFTLAMALDTGQATLDSTYDVAAPMEIGGGHIHDFDKGDARLKFWEVFTHSSNIAAAKIALRAGPERTKDYFRRFGLLSAAPSELVESARPILPARFDDSTLAHIAFGQGISVSPLALATGYRALLDGGIYGPLTIRKLPPGTKTQGKRVISEATSASMLQLMRLNVTDPKGSGRRAESPGLFVGGKTGSAQKPENGHYGKNNVSSFVAVFPATGPADANRYMVQITLDSPHATPETYGFITAGFNAAPTAGQVINRIAPFLDVKRVAGATVPQAPTVVSGAE
jgi:cell division protein FtsI (penicillin-binding protein 3)